MLKVQSEYEIVVSKLESENKVLKEQLEGKDEVLSASIQVENVKSSSNAFASVSHNLESTEQNNHELKHKLCVLERRERELNERLLEQKSCYNEMVSQLQDHDIVLKKMKSLECENSDLLDQIEHLREVERRFKEVHQSQEFLQRRVEELEQTESVSLAILDNGLSIHYSGFTIQKIYNGFIIHHFRF